MKFNFRTQLFAVLALLVNVNIAQATIITLQWDETVSSSDYIDVSVGETASFIFRFDVAGDSLANLLLNQSNFVDYTISFASTGEYATWHQPGSNTFGYSGNYFVFDGLGTLSSVSSFRIMGTDYTTSIAGLTGNADLYNNGANCILCGRDNFQYIDVNNVGNGLVASSWSVNATSVPEPSSLAILGLGLIGFATRRYKK